MSKHSREDKPKEKQEEKDQQLKRGIFREKKTKGEETKEETSIIYETITEPIEIAIIEETKLKERII